MKVIKGIVNSVLGLVSAVLGIVCYTRFTGSWESFKEYGGDAYTGIQNAAAQSANNITYLGDILKFGLGSILLIFGLYLLFNGIFSILDKPAASAGAPAGPAYTPKYNYTGAPAPVPAPAPVQTSPAPEAAPAPADNAAPVPSPAEPASGSKRFCTQCGSAMESGSGFCPNCGTKAE